jgi:hypothetical protein
MRSLIVLALSLSLLSGCSPPVQNGGASSDVELGVEPEVTEAGGTVELVLRNESSGEIGYNLCTSAIERRTDGGWAGVPSDRVCTMELRILSAGEITRYPYELPEGLAPGEYRFLANVEMMDAGGRRSVWSDPITITG